VGQTPIFFCPGEFKTGRILEVGLFGGKKGPGPFFGRELEKAYVRGKRWGLL